MSISVGIGLAFVAMLCWGFGDFFIQKSARKIGDIEALFFITLFGAVVLLPFVWRNLPAFLNAPGSTLLVVGLLCVTLFAAAVFDFEALRVGKLSVVEPIWSFEVPVAAFLAYFILFEEIGWLKIILIVLLLLGLALVSFKNKFQLRKLILERGTFIALLGAILMGAANFFMGWSARLADPIMANFVSDVFIALVCGLFLFFSGRISKSVKDILNNRAILLPMSIADKAAWVAFAFAMSLAPIAVATALSESYIIVAVALGLVINREKLCPHQKFGLVVSILAALALAALTA